MVPTGYVQSMKPGASTSLARLGKGALLRSSRPARSLANWLRMRRHPRCESVHQWAVATPGASVERVRLEVKVNRPRPTFLASDEQSYEYFSSFPSEYIVPERYLSCIPGGRVVGVHGLVVLPDGSLSTESTYHHLYRDWTFTEALRLGKPERLLEGNHYSLLNRFASGHNYYHWLHDVVIPLHDVLDQLPSDTRFVVPPALRGFQEESLAVVGLAGEQRLLEFDGGEVVRFESLYFAPPTALTLDHPEADLWFRDKALDFYRLDRRRPSRNIYISRRGARYRRVVNEDEILQLLQSYDFEVHQLEDYSFRDQVTLFAEAAMVVSGHGAGLANMIFSPPGLLVFDIFDSKRFSKYYWNLTAALGHSYWPILGIPVPSGHSLANDLALPADLLKDVIDRAVGEVPAE